MDNPRNFLPHVTSENTWRSTLGDKIVSRGQTSDAQDALSLAV